MTSPLPLQPIDEAPGAIYDLKDEVGARVGLPGGGLLAYFTGDMLHPPMILDETTWSYGQRWREGSERHVTEIAELAELRLGEKVLDVGCGLGGPARLLVDQFGVEVTSVTKSPQHAKTARRLMLPRQQWRRNITVHAGDCCDGVPGGPYDAAVSINMIYLVERKVDLFTNVYQALKPGGRFVLDDWMITDRVTEADLDELNKHFQSRHFLRVDELDSLMLQAGFPPIEAMVDRGNVGRTVMQKYFEPVTRNYFGPQVIADFPGTMETRPKAAAWGGQLIEEWIAAVNVTLRLYAERKMTYRRVLARRPA